MRNPVALAAFVSCLLCSAPAASQPEASVPFAFVDNRMVVECTIDGKGPFALIVDTGSPDMVVTPETARALGIAVRYAGSASGAGNARVRIGATKLATFALGSLTFRKLDASVLDLTEIRTKLGFSRLDGIVGYPILKRYAVVVDPDKRTLTFARSAPAVPPDATTTSFKGVIPEIPATIDGIATTAIVDTGDRSSLTLFGPFAKAHAFYDRYPSKPHLVTGYGLGGPVYGDVFTLPSIDLFGTHVQNVVTRASRQTGGVFMSTQQGGSVGEGVLKRFNLIYDYPNKRIIAWRSAYFDVPDRFVPPGSH